LARNEQHINNIFTNFHERRIPCLLQIMSGLYLAFFLPNICYIPSI
jgi:hypothetical protein